MASRKDEREAARQAREEQEQQAAAAARRKRMTQLGVGGVFLAAIVDRGADRRQPVGRRLVERRERERRRRRRARRRSSSQGIPQSGNVLGDPSAKVTVVEFGDPQCPVCKEFSEQVVPQFIASTVRSGEAKYEFKPWVIIGAAVEAGLRGGARRRRAGQVLQLHRALLPKPGRGELGLRHRRLHDRDREGRGRARTSTSGTRIAARRSGRESSRRSTPRRTSWASPGRRSIQVVGPGRQEGAARGPQRRAARGRGEGGAVGR